MTFHRPGARVCTRTGLVLVPSAGEVGVVQGRRRGRPVGGRVPLRAVDEDWAELGGMFPGHLPRVWRTARLLHTVTHPRSGWWVMLDTARVDRHGQGRAWERLAPGGVTDAVVESVRCRWSRHLIDRGGVAQRVGSPTAQPERVGKFRASLHCHDEGIREHDVAGDEQVVPRVRDDLDVGDVLGRVLGSGGHSAIDQQ